MLENKQYEVRTNTSLFQRRLIVKCMGKKEWIEQFCSYIARMFPPERIAFSPIFRSDKKKANYEYFCYINVIHKPTPNLKKKVELEKDSEGIPLEEEEG